MEDWLTQVRFLPRPLMIKPVRHIKNGDPNPNDDLVRVKKNLSEYGVELSDKTLEQFETANNPKVPFRHRLRKFLKAENGLGKAARVVKHGIILLSPFGKTVTDFAEHILIPEQTEKPMLSQALKRAFTFDGGGLFRLREEDGSISITAVLALVIRAAVVVGVLYACQQLGIPVDKALSLIGLG